MLVDQTFSTIGKNTTTKGDFSFSGPTHIFGKITGHIQMSNNAKLTLQIGSKVEANIESFDIDIYGEFSGDIRSKGLVTVFPTAIVSGKIIATSLQILPGANVNMNGHTTDKNAGADLTAPA